MAVGRCFWVISAGGVPQQGSMVRTSANFKRLYMFPNQSVGEGAPAIVPGDMRDLGRLTWSGYLHPENVGVLAGACALSGSPNFSENLVGAISVFSIAFGTPTIGALVADGCFGSHLRISARTNSLAQFSLDIMSKGVTAGSVGLPAAEEVEFFPLECGTSDVGDVLGFEIEYSTGFFARFAPDGRQGYSSINESLQLRSLRARIVMAHGAASGEWAAHAGVGRVAHAFTLVGNRGAGCTITVGGYYTGWRFCEVGGVLAEQAELAGVWDGSTYISIN